MWAQLEPGRRSRSPPLRRRARMCVHLQGSVKAGRGHGALRAVCGQVGAAGDRRVSPPTPPTLPPPQWLGTEVDAESPVPPALDQEGRGHSWNASSWPPTQPVQLSSCWPPRTFPVGTDLTLQGFFCPPPIPDPCSGVARSSPQTPGSGQSHTGAPGVLGIRQELSSDPPEFEGLWRRGLQPLLDSRISHLGVPWLGSRQPFVCLVSLSRDGHSSADPVRGGLEVPPPAHPICS